MLALAFREKFPKHFRLFPLCSKGKSGTFRFHLKWTVAKTSTFQIQKLDILISTDVNR
jgi:hypothetical protein